MVHERVSTGGGPCRCLQCGGSVEIVASGLHWEKSEASCGYLQNKEIPDILFAVFV
jgi:hypothetical protein